MAEQKNQNAPATPASTPAAPAASSPATLEAAMALIAQLIAKQTELQELALKTAPKARKTLEQYLVEKPRKKLHRESFQNGRPINPKGLSQKTIDLLDTVAPGTYGRDGVSVTVKRIDDGDKRYGRIHFLYSNKTDMQRYPFYMVFPTFTRMIEFIHEQMKVRVLMEPTPERQAMSPFNPVNDPKVDQPDDVVETVAGSITQQ